MSKELNLNAGETGDINSTTQSTFLCRTIQKISSISDIHYTFLCHFVKIGQIMAQNSNALEC